MTVPPELAYGDRGAAFPRVPPGSALVYEVELLHLRPEGASVQGRVVLGGTAPPDLVAEAEIFFAHLDQSRSQQLFGDHNFVFSGELKHLLGLAKVVAGRSDNKSTV